MITSFQRKRPGEMTQPSGSRDRPMEGLKVGLMSQLGQKRKSDPAILTSVLPSTADIRQRGGHVRKVPDADIQSGAAADATNRSRKGPPPAVLACGGRQISSVPLGDRNARRK